MQRIHWNYLSALVVLFLPSVKLQDYEAEAGRNLYSARYDNLNIDTILNSNRLVTNYVDCLTNKKPCPPEGKDLKRILPEALRTKCSKCSPKQKENALKVIRKLYEDYPQHYNALKAKWDPTGEYHRRFLEYLADEQFNQVGSNDFNRDQTQVNSQTVRPLPTTTRKPTTVRPLTTRATRSPAIESASVDTIIPQASFNSPSTSVLPNFNSISEVTTTTVTELTSSTTTEQVTTVSISTFSELNLTDWSTLASQTLQTDSNLQASDSPSVLPLPSSTTVSASSTPTTTETVQPKPSTQGGGVAVGNRFGEDFDSPVVASGQTAQPTSRAPQRTRPTYTTTTTTRWPGLFPGLFPPPQPNGQIAQVINHFGNKLTRTSEVIAGMIQNTARLLGGIVQPQPPPNYVN